MVPYYLKDNLKKIKEAEDETTAILASSSGNTRLDIFYYGETTDENGDLFITEGEFPCLIVAKDPISGEEFTVFDGAKHGYDAMFCNEYIGVVNRALKKYEKCGGEVQIDLGYSIDYEEEKDDYDFAGDKVKLMYGTMGWEDAKSIGFDWISLKFVDSGKDFFEMELA